MHAHTATCIHCSWECIRDGADGLHQSKCRTALESTHVLSILGSGMDLIQESAVDLKNSNLRKQKRHNRQRNKSKEKN
jgi:hypothetical protein